MKSTCMHFIFAVALCAMITLTAVDATTKKILVVGDSYAEYSGNAFGDFCDGAVQINRGIGGTQAVQWTAGGEQTNFAKAVSAAGSLTKNDVVVFSLGGNDFIPGCTKPQKQLTAEIAASMAALKTALGNCGDNCPKLVTFGYPKSTYGKEKECPTQKSLWPLKSALKAAAQKENVEFVDTEFICGGSMTKLAPKLCFGMCYKGTGPDKVVTARTEIPCYTDTIHLNQRGYCMTVTNDKVQKALGCKAKSYDCSAVDKDLDRTIRWPAKCDSFPCPNAPAPAPGPAPAPAPAPAPGAACINNNPGVAKASSGAFSSCTALKEGGYGCQHAQYGDTIRALCPVMCQCGAGCCAQAAAETPALVLSSAKAKDADQVVPEVDMLD